jgi:hypothetical protein
MVHDVVIEANRVVRLVVAPRLERAMRFEEPLVLYSIGGNSESLVTHEDLAEYANLLAVEELWTIERSGAALSIRRWQRRNHGLVTRSRTFEPIAPAQTLERRVQAAAARLWCESGTCDTADKPARNSGRPLATVAAGAGIAGMLGSWAAWARYADTRDDEFATIATVSTFAGSSLFVASAAWWVPEAKSVPAWAWVSGAAGTVAVGIGAKLWIDNDPSACPDAEGCWRKPLAPMLVSQGASLMSLPLTYLIREWTRTELRSVGAGVSPTQLTLHWVHELPSL